MDEALNFTKIAFGLFVLSLAFTVMTFMDDSFLGIFLFASLILGAIYSFKAIGRLGEVKDTEHPSGVKKTMLMFFTVTILLVHLFTICFLVYVIFIMDHHWDFG